jgi:hypothetical protein
MKEEIEKKSSTTMKREKELERIDREGGRVGTKDTDEMLMMIKNNNLLEAFFSMVPKLQYDLYTFYYWKFYHRSGQDLKNKWKKLTKKYDTFHKIIKLCHKKKLIKNDTFRHLNEIRNLRNDIAHWLTYDEPRVIISRKQVIDAVNKGISLIKDFKKQGMYLALKFIKKY